MAQLALQDKLREAQAALRQKATTRITLYRMQQILKSVVIDSNRLLFSGPYHRRFDASSRLGHADEARQWFAKAVEWTDAHAGKVPNEIGFGTVLWGWHDEGARRLLQREADELLHGPPTDRPAPPPK